MYSNTIHYDYIEVGLGIRTTDHQDLPIAILLAPGIFVKLNRM